MFLKILLVICLFGIVRCTLQISEVSDVLEKNLNFLEAKMNTGPNVTFFMAWAAKDLQLALTFPKISKENANTIKKFKDRLHVLALPLLDSYNLPVFSDIIKNPQLWAKEEFRFKPGRLGTKDVSDLENVIGRSIQDTEAIVCFIDLFKENNMSLTPRVCNLGCHDNVYKENDLEKGLILEGRVEYISYEIILNCTNDMEIREKILTEYCSNILAQLSKMERDDLLGGFEYYYLLKILLCGPAGYPEFYAEDRIRDMMSKIGADGSVNFKVADDETKYVLTASFTAVFAGVLRMLTEINQ